MATLDPAGQADAAATGPRRLRQLGRRALGLLPDPFTLAILAALLVGLVVPVHGVAATSLDKLTKCAIALLFFLHGAKISRETILRGIMHWRLHLLVLASTFVAFPVFGAAVQFLPRGLLNPDLAAGFLFLSLLPSTVQSSVAFTAVAGGNVPSAVCSASISNLLGMFVTPLMVSLTMHAHQGGISWETVRPILFELLAPFAAGQAVQTWVRPWLLRHSRVVGLVDRGSIVLVVYTAVSAATVEGYWRMVSLRDLGLVVLVSAVILACMLAATTVLARRLGFSKADEIAIVFCGSKKSLASGAPLAGALFPAAAVGGLLLPVIVFHQIQLVTCGVLARRYARHADAARLATPDVA